MTVLQTSTLRPGLLVSLSTSCRGNVSYQKIDLDEEHNGVRAKAKWETTRTIEDAVELEAAKKALSKARQHIRRVCFWSAFGLLCPEANADVLEDAIRDARRVVDEFNASASLTRIHLYVIAGKIAQDDVEAVRAINSEVRDLLDTMAAGIERLDVKAVREAATKAKQLGGVLSPLAQANVQIAIDAARKAATQINAAGEAAAVEVDRTVIRQITEQRTAFLDIQDEVAIARPQATARNIDFAVEVE
jgi:hypothetical protein